MKLPEPLAGFRQNHGWGGLWEQVIPEAMNEPDVTRMYSEAQVKALLAQADSMLIAHMNGADQMRKRYESVLKQAMEALEYANPLMECYWGNNASEAITEIKKVLG